GEYFHHEGKHVKAKGKTHENAATTRCFSEASSVKVVQGVSGDVQDKGFAMHFLPYLYARLQYSYSMKSKNLQVFVHVGQVRFELRTASAQVEGGVYGSHS
ncbi:hypothetical protein FOMPIDRAFT_1123798, partial [Fomitopsis schrenkii]